MSHYGDAISFAGKTFFRKKKQPVPINLQSSEWGRTVKAATEATYMFAPKGNSISIRYTISPFKMSIYEDLVLRPGENYLATGCLCLFGLHLQISAR